MFIVSSLNATNQVILEGGWNLVLRVTMDGAQQVMEMNDLIVGW